MVTIAGLSSSPLRLNPMRFRYVRYSYNLVRPAGFEPAISSRKWFIQIGSVHFNIEPIDHSERFLDMVYSGGGGRG